MIRKLYLFIIPILFLACTESEIKFINQIDNSLRYNTEVFENVAITRDVRYGANATLGGSTLGLTMNIYEPEGDTEVNRPLVVLAHGGGFTSGNKNDLDNFASFLAKSGYVVASIDYRLLDITPSEEAFKKVVINAVADMKAAVRFFNKDKATDNLYRINSSNIFIGGYSAGAITALHYGYVKTNAELTDIGGSTFLEYVKNNGGIDGLSGNENYPSNVKGIINISGSLFNSSFVNSGEPSLYSIHGTNDTVVPYNKGNTNNTGVITEGSNIIHQKAVSAGITNSLKTIQNGEHDAFFKCGSCFSETRAFIFSQL